MEWLDAMRGFTMILVVAYHVAQMGFGESEKLSAALPFLVLFRMPLFFFVSGFLAYKATFEWTVPNALALTWKKIKIQVLPALVFLCLFIVFRKSGGFWGAFEYCMKSPTKGGYWFTWVLLQMFIIYYALCLISRKRNWPVWVLWALSVFVYATVYMPKVFTYHKDLFFNYSSLIETMKFMQFFLLGNLVHRYWKRVQWLMDTSWFFPIVITVAVVCCADIFRWHTLKFMWTNLPRTLAMYSLLMLVVMFFRHYQAWFQSDRLVGKSLQYIGTRTLDVYLLHFLLIPKLPEVGKWLDANRPNFVLDITLSVSLALLVIAFCLLISNLLRVSPFLSEYLFGRPLKKRADADLHSSEGVIPVSPQEATACNPHTASSDTNHSREE